MSATSLIIPENKLAYFKIGPIEFSLNKRAARAEIPPRKIQDIPVFGNYAVEQKRSYRMTAERLRNMALSDPIIWSIMKTRRDQITQTKWDIVQDLDHIFADLDRWEQVCIRNLNEYGIKEHFKPIVLTEELIEKVSRGVFDIINNGMKDAKQKKKNLSYFFEAVKNECRQDADVHRHVVKQLLKRPNNLQKNFTTFAKVVADDILQYDAGIMIKNHNELGELAEIYTVPGYQVKPVLHADGSVPEPPEAAYLYYPVNALTAGVEFSSDELIYISDSPSHNGLGLSPLELSVYVIAGSLYAEQFNLDFLKHSNVPPGLLALGKDITDDQRETFQMLWDQEVRGQGGLQKILFAAGFDITKENFIPMRLFSNVDMQLMEYLKWTLSIKCMCFQISPQDLGFVQDFHRTTAEVQKELSKSRGLKNLLGLFEQTINEEIVKTCWTFDDVKFKWLDVDLEDESVRTKNDDTKLRAGVLSHNEVRSHSGDKPIEGGDKHYIFTASGPLALEDLAEQEEKAKSDEQSANEWAQSAGPKLIHGAEAVASASVDQPEKFNDPENAPVETTPPQVFPDNHPQNQMTANPVLNTDLNLAVGHNDSLLIQTGTLVKALEGLDKKLDKLQKEMK
jgi:HK97 family phage portal protein